MKKYKKINSIFEDEVEHFDIDCLCEYYYFKKGENHISNANIYRNMNTMILHFGKSRTYIDGVGSYKDCYHVYKLAYDGSWKLLFKTYDFEYLSDVLTVFNAMVRNNKFYEEVKDSYIPAMNIYFSK